MTDNSVTLTTKQINKIYEDFKNKELTLDDLSIYSIPVSITNNLIYFSCDIPIRRSSFFKEGLITKNYYNFVLDKLKNGHTICYNDEYDERFTSLFISLEYITFSDDKDTIEWYIINNGQYTQESFFEPLSDCKETFGKACG